MRLGLVSHSAVHSALSIQPPCYGLEKIHWKCSMDKARCPIADRGLLPGLLADSILCVLSTVNWLKVTTTPSILLFSFVSADVPRQPLPAFGLNLPLTRHEAIDRTPPRRSGPCASERMAMSSKAGRIADNQIEQLPTRRGRAFDAKTAVKTASRLRCS